MGMSTSRWKNEKTKSIASWIINTPDVCESARTYALSYPEAPILYRSWIRNEGLHKVLNPEGISVLDPELDFGTLSEVLWTLTIEAKNQDFQLQVREDQSTIANETPFSARPEFSTGKKVFQWVIALFVAFVLIGALGLSETSPEPNGVIRESNADDSINDPRSTFEDQSKR
jgi:hypothetical protein